MRLMARFGHRGSLHQSLLSLLGSNTAAAQLTGNLPSMPAWDMPKDVGSISQNSLIFSQKA
jgi:hypothetical protein